jgi:hypothetical protein
MQKLGIVTVAIGAGDVDKMNKMKGFLMHIS